MRQGIGVVVAVGVLAAVVWWGQVASQHAEAAPLVPGNLSAGGMIAHVLEDENRPQRVIVIDPASRVMAVYDVVRDSGEIQLKSVRNIAADLQMLEFNSGAPSPADIQETLQRK
jgi:hypothetical protein